MKFNSLRIMALTTIMSTTMFAATADAQNTLTIPVTATVNNVVTLNQVDPMAFGTLVAINRSGDTGTIVLGGDDVLTETDGTNAKFIDVNSAATAAEFTANGVNGADVNYTITAADVVPPTSATNGDVIPISAFTYSTDAGTTDNPVVLDAPFTVAATGADQTFHIGATLTTPDQAAQIENDVYTGEFVITAEY